MTLVLVEVADEAAMQRLRQQGVRVVGVLTEPLAVETTPVPAAPRKWTGSIPATSAEAWDKHLHEIRGEWERDM
ncbi:hypothetical protein [Hymenobacter sp. UYP22]|uniref:hypothetical protein n=1 Tax=Hymenobacter sp. UYP22 TaxID=3156348 RepID=UPI003397E81B